jgi:hypothetical protein
MRGVISLRISKWVLRLCNGTSNSFGESSVPEKQEESARPDVGKPLPIFDKGDNFCRFLRMLGAE